MTPEVFDAQFAGRNLGECAVKLIGARGYHLSEGKPGENDLGIFDDAIFRKIGDEVTEWRASTDPGRYYIRNPMNPKGCAQLQPGLWWFRLGMHLNAHPALIQESAFTVWRLDEVGSREQEEHGFFGVNLHSGGAEYQVGKWSAGCQIIQSTEGGWGATWQRFYQPIAAAKPKRIPYLLVENLKAIPV